MSSITTVFLAIAETTNKFEKLIMVLGEMRGEMGLAVKGDLQAKQRLEASKECLMMFIKLNYLYSNFISTGYIALSVLNCSS